jgi:hypothetical protein
MPFGEYSLTRANNVMKAVCQPDHFFPARFNGRDTERGRWVYYRHLGRPCTLYARSYVVPRNPRTPPQILMRQLFGALSKDWLGLLTLPQRDAWIAFARNYNRRVLQPWIAYARCFSRCPPHTWTPYHRRVIRRCLWSGRPLTGPQAFLRFNSVLVRSGQPKLLWPPPPPLPFRPNPVQEVRLRWEAAAAAVSQRQSDQKSKIKNQKSPSAPRLRLELVLHRRVKGDLRLFASAPCSAGWSNLRHPVCLGLLPAPGQGVHDITALYLARFRAPAPNERVFICASQHRHGWQSGPQDLSAIVPPMPAPLPPPAPNGQWPILNSQFSIGPRRFPSSILHPLSSIFPPGTHRAYPQCTRGTLSLHSPAPDLNFNPNLNLNLNLNRLCQRRKSCCRELWRGT